MFSEKEAVSGGNSRMQGMVRKPRFFCLFVLEKGFTVI